MCLKPGTTNTTGTNYDMAQKEILSFILTKSWSNFDKKIYVFERGLSRLQRVLVAFTWPNYAQN